MISVGFQGIVLGAGKGWERRDDDDDDVWEEAMWHAAPTEMGI